MNHKRLMMALCFIGASALMQNVFAYKVKTHVRLSQKAATCSVLSRQEFLTNLGLIGLDDENPIWRIPIDEQDEDPEKWILEWISEYEKPNDKGYKSTIKTLIGWGAKYEDEEDKTRPFNHFYNPITNMPLPVPTAKTSPDWALEDGRPQPNLLLQENSFFDA